MLLNLTMCATLLMTPSPERQVTFGALQTATESW